VLRFDVKAGPTGSLFGSVTPTNIADELWATKKVRVDRRKIETDPIKRIGRYEIPITLFDDVRARLLESLIRPIEWRSTLLALHAAGARRFLDVGPSDWMADLVRRTLPSAQIESAAA